MQSKLSNYFLFKLKEYHNLIETFKIFYLKYLKTNIKHYNVFITLKRVYDFIENNIIFKILYINNYDNYQYFIKEFNIYDFKVKAYH